MNNDTEFDQMKKWSIHSMYSDSEPLEIGTLVLGHSIVCLPVCSHHSLIRFTRALRCAHSFARSLTHSLRSSWERDLCLWIECVDFSFNPLWNLITIILSNSFKFSFPVCRIQRGVFSVRSRWRRHYRHRRAGNRHAIPGTKSHRSRTSSTCTSSFFVSMF